MSRISVYIIFILLIYISVSFFQNLNAEFNIDILDYEINISLLSGIILFIIFQLALYTIIKIIENIINIPHIISNFFTKRKNIYFNEKLKNIITESVINKENYDNNINNNLKQIKSYLDPKQDQNMLNIIEYLNSKDKIIQNKILKRLCDQKNYSFFAYYNLAKNYNIMKNFEEAEFYGMKAFNLNDVNLHLLILLTNIYYKLKSFDKLNLIISKIIKLKIQLDKKIDIKNKIVDILIDSSKESIKQNNDTLALNMIEKALELEPDNVQAIELFTKIEIANNNIKAAQNMLISILNVKPSFEIVKIYINMMVGREGFDSEELYQELTEIDSINNDSDLKTLIKSMLKM